MNLLQKIKFWFIGEYLENVTDRFERSKIIFIYHLSIFYTVSNFLYVIYLVQIDYKELAWLNTLGCIASNIIPFALRYSRNIQLSSGIFSVCALFLLFTNNFLMGGLINVFSGLWLLFSILYSFFTSSKKWGYIFCILSIGVLVLSIALTSLGYGTNYMLSPEMILHPEPISVLIPLAFCLAIIIWFINTRNETEKVLKTANKEQEILNKELIKREEELVYQYYQLHVLNERLKESEHRLAETLKIARLGSWEVNCTEKTTLWSEEAFEIAGIDSQSKAPSIYEYLSYVHPEDLLILADHFNKAIKQALSFELEFRHRMPNGNYKHIFTKVKPIMADGKVIKIQGTAQDITERVRVEEELIAAKEKAEKASVIKSQFLSTMSHEIRTPMNAVIGLTHLLLQENPRAEQLNNLKILKFSAQNLLSLINDILDFNKIEEGKVKFEQIHFSLEELVNSVKYALGTHAKEKEIDFHLQVDTGVPEMVIGDPVRLTQVLNNLIGNAIKFTEKGEVRLDIRVSSESEESVALDFAIHDSGIGIAEENLDYIFERFTQANSDTTRKFGGTGLGLAITKHLLELQGSNIQVKSKLGEGSHFYFTLNFKKSKKTYLQETDFMVHESKTLDVKGRQLLLVDDNPINQLIASKFLAKLDLQIDYANNGREALEKIQTKDYDMVLMDLQMPEMDGYEATLAIRSLSAEKYKQIPIIALTASVMQDVQDKVYEVGMNDFISKPFNPNELQKKISYYLHQKYPVNNSKKYA